jgi:hypothetical protein
VRFGLDLLRDRRLTAIDVYSFTQDRPWVNHEWLSELMFGFAYRQFGTLGLAALKAIVLCSSLVIVQTVLEPASTRVRLSALAFWFVAAAGMVVTLRPQMWTLLLLAVLCRILVAGTARQLLSVPLLFVPWANLHGGWIVGLGVLFLWTAAECLQHRPGRASRLSLLMIALSSLGLTLVNPYGFGLWSFIASTVGLRRSDIVEWQPLWRAAAVDWLPWIVVVSTSALLMIRRETRPSLSRLAVAVMLAYASLRVSRVVALFVEATIILWSPEIIRQWPARNSESRTQTPAPAMAAALVLVALAIAASTARAAATCLPITGDWSPDRAAAAALHESRAQGRIVTWFGWGEYALWHLYPDLKVSIDGRRETVYSERVVHEHDQIYQDGPAGFAVIAAWNPEYVWLPASRSRTKAWLKAHGYRIDFESERSFVAVRSDHPTIEPPPLNGPACFPG